MDKPAILLNAEFIRQVSFDSASPGGSSSVLHRFDEPGEYVVSFVRDEQIVQRAALTVRKVEPTDREVPTQVEFDLTALSRPAPKEVCCPVDTRIVDEFGSRFSVKAGGYASFTASKPQGAYLIRAERVAEGEKYRTFRSEHLEGADLFAVTLIRPGTYSVDNLVGGAQSKIRVAYPVVGTKPYRPPPPVTIECTESGFSPSLTDLQPAQGVVYKFKTPSRIKIRLEQRDDGPASGQAGAPSASGSRDKS
jgi:hypothetical protein